MRYSDAPSLISPDSLSHSPRLSRRHLELVEYLGSGMPRILKAYSRDAYEFSSRFIRTTFLMDPEALKLERATEGGSMGGAIGGQMGGPIGGQITLPDRQNTLLELIRKNPKVSRKEIAHAFGINQSAVQKRLESLKQKGVLKRIGGTRGHWEVLH